MDEIKSKKTRVVSFRLPATHADRLERLAVERKIPVGQMVMRMVIRRLAELEDGS